MQRYFLPEEHFSEDKVTISGEDARHISKVMRMRSGDKILCCTPAGRTALCEIDEISGDSVTANLLDWKNETNELPVSVTIAQGLPKADKLEWIVQKGTELGATSFIPFTAARSVVKWDQKKASKKIERLQKIAKEAAEQSHRSFIPTITSLSSIKGLLEEVERYTIKLVAFEESAKAGEMKGLAKALQQVRPEDSLLVVIGPEGGLTEEEAIQFERHGFSLCGLGPRIMRTETAPLYVLSAVSYQLELMR